MQAIIPLKTLKHRRQRTEIEVEQRAKDQEFYTKTRNLDLQIQHLANGKAGLVSFADYETPNDVKKAAIDSLSTQIKGKYNRLGPIAQYPFFAPDLPFVKPAPKASQADIKFLEHYTSTKANSMVINKVPKGDQMKKQEILSDIRQKYVSPKIRSEYNLKSSDLISSTLKADRQIDGESLTSNIFKEASKSVKNSKVLERIQTDTDLKLGRHSEIRQTGRIVPFFPTDWNKNANDMFNQDHLILEYMKGDKFEAIQELTDYGHFEGEIINNPALGGARPTSGKHYSRHFDSENLNKYLQNATQPPQKAQKDDLSIIDYDDLKSTIAKQFEATCKVDDLLSKLSSYLSGNIASLDTAADSISVGETNYFDKRSLNRLGEIAEEVDDRLSAHADQRSQVNTALNQAIDQLTTIENQTQDQIEDRKQKRSEESPDRNTQNLNCEQVELCCSSSQVYHRFHQHPKIRNRAEKIIKLNT